MARCPVPWSAACAGALRWLLSLGCLSDSSATWPCWVFTASSGNARLVAGQFHDVVLVGEVAYRFPREEESRRRLPAAVARLAALGRAGPMVPVPLGTGHIRSPLGRCHVPLTRLPGKPLGQVSGRRAEAAVVTELAALLDRLAELGSDQPIRTLVPQVGADHWTAFAG